MPLSLVHTNAHRSVCSKTQEKIQNEMAMPFHLTLQSQVRDVIRMRTDPHIHHGQML